jgi:hypothetical protein
VAGSRGFSITISAVDEASKAIDAVNRNIAAIRSPFDRAGKSLAKFSDVTGMKKLAGGFRDVARESFEAFENIGRGSAALESLTGAAAVAGVVKLSDKWASWGANLKVSASRAGTTASQLARLQGAAQLAGSSADAMTSGVTALNDNLNNAAAGVAPQAMLAFAQLKISLRDATLQVRKGADVLPELADKLKAIPNPVNRAKLAQMALGGSAESLWRVLSLGSGAIKKLEDRAAQLNGTTNQSADAADKAREANAELGLAFQGLENTIGSQFAPVITSAVQGITAFVEQHPHVTAAAAAIGGAIAGLAGGLGTLRLAWVAIMGVQKKAAAGAVAAAAEETAAAKEAAAAARIEQEAAAGPAAGGMGRGVRGGIAGSLAAQGLTVFGAVEKMQEMNAPKTATQNDAWWKSLPPDSPYWQGVPEAQQKRFPNSPLNADNRSPFARLMGWGKSGGTSPPTTASAPAPGAAPMMNGDLAKREAAVRDRLGADLGLTKDQASGVVSNLVRESGLQGVNEKNPLVPGSRGGFGWAQWTGTRRVAFEKWAGANKLDPKSDEANYGYLVHELKSGQFSGVMRSVRGTSDATSAAKAFFPYESGGDPRVASGAAAHAAAASQIAALPSAPPALVAGGTGGGNAAAGAVTVRGSADLNVRVSGPPGTTTTASTSGDLFNGAPKIAQAMQT